MELPQFDDSHGGAQDAERPQKSVSHGLVSRRALGGLDTGQVFISEECKRLIQPLPAAADRLPSDCSAFSLRQAAL
jgi:hypothetical protein